MKAVIYSKTIKANKTQAGFSLIELMIVMVVMMIILGAAFSFLRVALQHQVATFETTEAQQNLRFAHEYLNRDLITAGDGMRGVSDLRLPLTFVQAYLSNSPATELDPDDDGYVSLSIITSNNNVPANTVVPYSNPSSQVLTGTDRITMMTVDSSFTPITIPANNITPSGSNVNTTPADLPRFSIGEIYYITSGIGATFGCITNITGETGNNPNLIFADSDPYDLNHPGNGGPINVVSDAGRLSVTMLRMKIVHYYVNNSEQLIRRVFGIRGTGFVDSIIAEHITGLNFRYNTNLTNADGTLQQPFDHLATAEERSAVRQVEIGVTASTIKPIINGTTRQQINSSSQVSVRNLQFREARQPTSADLSN